MLALNQSKNCFEILLFSVASQNIIKSFKIYFFKFLKNLKDLLKLKLREMNDWLHQLDLSECLFIFMTKMIKEITFQQFVTKLRRHYKILTLYIE